MLELDGFEAGRRFAGLVFAVAVLLSPASAQTTMPDTGPGADAPPPAAPGATTAQAKLSVSAQFANDRKPVRSGLNWRILSEAADGSPARIVARSTEPEPSFSLPPGTYVVHAAYGFASGTKRVNLGMQGLRDQVQISAGALSLAGSIGDAPIPAGQLTFSVFVPLQGNSEGRLVTSGAKAGEVIRLPEGTYHVVSTYGDSNAIQRADVKVETGKVTEATLHHRAAKVTLKLVANAGGEAFAGTAFSVLTPGGDVIREAIGAFPQVILAEGDYVLIARQEGQVYSRDFKVESGTDRDIEVLAK
ncbi:conserved hypothetical protein [Hyphomicrobiales bacterium]|nr:conserved hypothetical protein [Hyphomicrobiales bacterium]CAH1701023.1 conserved hypothetical protein [Hyphomicrobiales bacterium]CAI0344082.1 conserved hypothetical protein [Hyphomicrobiales bacterium]